MTVINSINQQSTSLQLQPSPSPLDSHGFSHPTPADQVSRTCTAGVEISTALGAGHCDEVMAVDQFFDVKTQAAVNLSPLLTEDAFGSTPGLILESIQC
ncbi:hypothetical protein RB195_009909 [Necator americanus]|uniref:Uncharacterized protein n=1 Tax=Necator americanus TaxID=51031 RepID=A0ABR1CVH5_NECAM